MMIKIGDFAKIGQVSVKTLRYYDEIGLLRAAHIDPWTGYRYYSFDQLPRLHRILALKDLGLALDQIAPILEGALPAVAIRGMLRLKQAEVQDQVEILQTQLSRLEARLQQIEQEHTMPDYEVVLKNVDAIRVAGVRGVVPTEQQINQTFNRLFDTVGSYLERHGARVNGPGIGLWHDTFEHQAQDIIVAAALPTESDLPAEGDVHTHTLPAVPQMACVVHRGSFAGLGPAYEAVLRWIAANGYTPQSPSREVYLEYERDGDPSRYVTEIQFPVEKA